ncbi:MAG: glycosyltransferase [Candidatus Poribacteria bacterium]
MTRLILASLHYYLSHYSDDLEHPKQAVALDPDFPFYKLRYAKKLVKRGKPGDYAEAGALLTQLAESSILFEEAFELLKQLQGQKLFVSPQFAELARAAIRVHHNLIAIKNLGIPIFNADWRSATLQPAATPPAWEVGSEEIQSFRLPTRSMVSTKKSTKKCLVSALVPTYNAERFMRGLLEDLEAQTIADQLEIVIVDSNSPQNERAIVEEFQQRYDNIVYVRTDEWENSHAGINRCIQLAQGKYLTLACTDDRHKPDAYERMVAVMEARPDIALVYANCYITATENETFFNHTPVGAYRWIDFNPLRLLHGCFMGPQPMWRKSVHEKYGYFDENLKSAGDWDFWLRMAESETFLHIDEFLGLYLYSPTSSEHRDPELSRREAQLVQQRYLHREEELREKQRRAQHNQPATSGTLVLVVRGTEPNEQVARCVSLVRLYSSSSPILGMCSTGDLSLHSIRGQTVKVVRAHPDIPENDLDVKVSPETPTALEALNQGAAQEARFVVLLSPDVIVTRSWLDKLLAVIDADPSIAAVGPTSNAAPAPQRVEVARGQEGKRARGQLPFSLLAEGVCEERSNHRSEQDYGNFENELQEFADWRASQYGDEWEEVPYLGGFCLLLSSEAVRQVGGLVENLSLPLALFELYARLQDSGFKLACARGAYVHHAELTEEEGAGYDDLAAAEQYVREAMAAGQAAIERGDFFTAVVEFEQLIRNLPDKAVSLNPNYSSLYDELGKCFYKIGKIEHAKNAFVKASKLNSQDSQAYSNLGVLFWETGNVHYAIKNLKQAVEINPDDVDAVANLAIICYQVGLFFEAIPLFKKFLMRQPQDAQMRFYLSDCYFKTGENLMAKKELQIVLAAEEEHQLAQELYAKLTADEPDA